MSSFLPGLKAKSRRARGVTRAAASAECTRRFAQNDLLPSLALVVIPIAELALPRHAVRKQDEAHVVQVRSAIETFGFTIPIFIGKGNEVIDGLVRIAAAKQLGLTSVPAVRVEHLDVNQQKLLRLASNRLGEKGEWDFDELRIVFDEMIADDIPVALSGFTTGEVDQILLGDDRPGIERGPLVPDPTLLPVARLGDLFVLGDHLLVCGDARDPSTLRQVMGADRARLLCTDPPYNVRIAGNVSTKHRREFVMGSGELSDEEFGAFNRAWIDAALPHLVDGALCAPFIDWRGQATVTAAAGTCHLELINLIVWSKTNGGMGSLYRSGHELLPLFKYGRAAHVNNVQLGAKGRNRTNVWSYAGASTVGSDARRGLKEHPTVKPTSMLMDFLLDVTNRGEIVLDPFVGSGSMLIAAERTGRCARGIELDPLFVDVAIRRWQAETGRNALCAKTGTPFDEITGQGRIPPSAPCLPAATPYLLLPPPPRTSS